jgi:hypothetical protein
MDQPRKEVRAIAPAEKHVRTLRTEANEGDRVSKGYTFTVPRPSDLLNSTRNPTMRFVGVITCFAIPSMAFARNEVASASIGLVVVAGFVTILIAARRRGKREAVAARPPEAV